VASDFVTSIDGAVAVAGRSGGLSGEGDHAVFHALRSVADVILVGAGTVRAEDYGPARLPTEDQERRRSLGQDPVPVVAVVSGRLDLDHDARLFAPDSSGQARPIVFTVEAADATRRAALQAVAEIVDVGETTFEPVEALRLLAERGAEVIVCEGGPTLQGTLLAADLVDEVCLSLAPLLANGEAPRMAHGLPLDPAMPMALDRVIEDDGYLFLRYLRHDPERQ
jgi:riboflavin-specific deaminase-like protein